jgi:hypothetical protein
MKIPSKNMLTETSRTIFNKKFGHHGLAIWQINYYKGKKWVIKSENYSVFKQGVDRKLK